LKLGKSEERTTFFEEVPLWTKTKNEKMKKSVADSHHNTRTLFFTQKTISIRRFSVSRQKNARAQQEREKKKRRERERARCNFLAVSSRTPEREREEEESLIDIFIIARLAEIHALARIKD